MTSPRNLKKLFAIGGFFDPCDDQTQMQNNWERAYLENPAGYPARGIYWDVVAAPGGAGGFAHKLYGTTGTPTLLYYGHGGISPFTGGHDNKQGTLPVYSPLKWKYRAEFRMYIVADVNTGTLENSGGFGLDGVASFAQDRSSDNFDRIAVHFNVGTQKAGIVTAEVAPVSYPVDVFNVSWAGSYNTWYDIIINWSYDFYTAPNTVTIAVSVNGTPLFTHALIRPKWLHSTSAGTLLKTDMYASAFHGRCGLVLNGLPGLNDQDVELYFKDIFVTLEDTRIIEYEYKDSVILTGTEVSAQGLLRSDYPKAINRGMDMQIWLRNSTSDNWKGCFRGIIRTSERERANYISFDAEGYWSSIANEKAENLSLSTKTTGEIIIEAINNPSKLYLNTSAYFDTTTLTYSRDYIQTAKIDIVSEASDLEGFLLWVDQGLNVHFQSPRTNISDIHLEYGASLIHSYFQKEIFDRSPNKIRINGSGVYSERTITETMFATNIQSVRNINRPELTTQSEVDDYCDYITSLYLERKKYLIVNLRANFLINTGDNIRVTIPDLNFFSSRFSVIAIQNNQGKRMTLTLIDLSSGLSGLLGDLGKRTDINESEQYASDTSITTKLFQAEGEAKLLIKADYEIEYNSVIQRSGRMLITDDFIDDLLDVWDGTPIDDPTHIGYGTGSTSPSYDDTTLETQTARAAATSTKDRASWDATSLGVSSEKAYHTIKFELNISNPTNLSELGLFNASITGGTLACRSTFTPYTQVGTVTLRITIWLEPTPGAAYISFMGIDDMISWLHDGSWTALNRIMMVFCGTEALPEQFKCWNRSRLLFASNDTFVPTTGHGTLTSKVIYPQDRIRFKFVYLGFNASTDFYLNYDPDSTEWAMGLYKTSDYFSIVSYLYGSLNPVDYLDSDATWFIWLKILRAETDA